MIFGGRFTNTKTDTYVIAWEFALTCFYWRIDLKQKNKKAEPNDPAFILFVF